MNGHEHDYERFAPQSPAGSFDGGRGIREFVVGTGGAALRPFPGTVANSETRTSDAHGVLKLSLFDSRYEWEFVPISGIAYQDSGSGSCHA